MTLLHQAAQKAVEALKRARQFIHNGVEYGYIKMPAADCPDSAHETPHVIFAALKALESALQQQEVPREPVGHVHKDWHASQGQGRIYGHCPGSDYVQVYASPSTTQQQEVGSEPDAMEAHRTNGLAWAVSCWQAEVMNRPLVNVHRRTLDDTWRQVIRYFGGDPDKLLGPNHDTLHMRAQEERAWKP